MNIEWMYGYSDTKYTTILWIDQLLLKNHIGLQLLNNIDIRLKVNARAGLSVCVLSNVAFISQVKAIWLSAKILIKICTLSTDSAILIWTFYTMSIFAWHLSYVSSPLGMSIILMA